MESVQIMAQVSSEESIPGDWLVFPLQRQKVLVGILGWIFGAVVGGLMFALMAPIMIPHNYFSGVFSAVLSTLVLGIVLYVCLGSIWALITDLLRLREAEKHVIIITPEDFLMRDGKKVIHVPLEYVKYVTARGTPPVDRSAEAAAEDARPIGIGEGLTGLFIGRRAASGARKGGFGRRRMRTPTTLAFVDSRTDKEVIVVTDKAFGDPFFIGENLKAYANAAAIK
jgi:hypothetical protein